MSALLLCPISTSPQKYAPSWSGLQSQPTASTCRPANLTATEFKILALLAENPGEVFTRSHLLDRLGDDGEIYERTLDRHINNLRKKIEDDPRNPEYVLTVYGIGYKMRRV